MDTARYATSDQPLSLGSSVLHVLHTPELCELILLELSFKDLLSCQSASRLVRDTIKGSVNLQRKLWYQSDPPARTLTRGIYGYRPFVSINPLLLRYLIQDPYSSPPFMAVYPGKMESNRDKIVVSFDVNLLGKEKGSWQDMLVAEGGDMGKEVPLVCFLYDGCDYGRRVAMFDKPFPWGITAGKLTEEVKRQFEDGQAGFAAAWEGRDKTEREATQDSHP